MSTFTYPPDTGLQPPSQFRKCEQKINVMDIIVLCYLSRGQGLTEISFNLILP